MMGKDFLKENKNLVEAAQKKAGIDPEKVQKVVSSYLQIARDNQLNYNELLQVQAKVKESVVQSLNKLSISALPVITSDAANE